MKTIWTLFLALFITTNLATAQDTLYVYKTGAVIFKQAVTGVDSITFAKNYFPTAGLVAWYPFNGNANDESGNGNNGTVNGTASLTTDRFGNANKSYSFHGLTSEYINVKSANNLKLQNTLSISVWIYMDGGYYNPRILDMGNGGNSGYFISVYGTSNTSRNIVGVFTDGNGHGTSTSFTVTALTWHHIVFTVDLASNAKLYVDGELKSSSIGTVVNTAVYSTDLNIGRMTHSAYDAWGGKLDDIGIWNRALTQEEVTTLYNEK